MKEHIKHLFFGKKPIDSLTKVFTIINLICWFIFQMWHILSLLAIHYRGVILEEKKIDVEKLLLQRGAELGFDPEDFIHELVFFHQTSIILWLIFLLSVFMMFRKKLSFIYFLSGSLGLYFLFMLFIMGFQYWQEDSTLFDKIVLFLILVNSFIFYYIQKNHASKLEELEEGNEYLE